jgi:integrase
MALARSAASEQDGAIYLTAAFTGLRRGELLALRWRDVDLAGSLIRVRASYAAGASTSLKSGKVRSVPTAPDVTEALARLASAVRSSPTTTSSFLARRATTWTARRCVAATAPH